MPLVGRTEPDNEDADHLGPAPMQLAYIDPLLPFAIFRSGLPQYVAKRIRFRNGECAQRRAQGGDGDDAKCLPCPSHSATEPKA